MSPLVIYGVITVSCALILFIMSVFGADQDIGADIDVDLDVDADIDVEGLDTAEAAGPSKFSLRLILIFVTGFGVSGFVATYYDCPVPHVIVGLLGGVLTWFGGYEALGWLYRQQSTSEVKAVSFVGKQARVTVPIPKGGTGEVFSRAGPTGKSICVFFPFSLVSYVCSRHFFHLFVIIFAAIVVIWYVNQSFSIM